ncbi:transcription factor BIM2 isoform X1 [Cinnamomum micranthum f. kanehirae]|uniref:Transcription factor BIM2 isoform X1 n=1 Tax=Cinnamomum micranthum f. kanehirae TaxID=337451 RepID=A0A3S3R5X5_9MAGN|nr:transcription factor BIM2 isoform X1 [Cinnamomum micranthum f. kanehirae]
MDHNSTFAYAVVKPERNAYTMVQETNVDRIRETGKTNSNCSSYNGGGFTLWDESAVKLRSVGKDGVGESQLTRETSEKSAQFPPFISGCTGFGSMASSKYQGQRSERGFMEIMKAVKGFQEDEEDDEEDYVKKESSSQQGDVGVKGGAKGNEQRANTPRSKHSATEQRRRSKINDRFQMLRQLIPHSDQKRDKASFLLEVIEYIQVLQEKVLKYEAAFPGWNQDTMKFMPWKHNHGLGESIADHSRATKNGADPELMFVHKFNDNNVAVTPSMLVNTQNPVDSTNMSMGTHKEVDRHVDLANKASSLPIPLQQSVYTSSAGRNSGIAQRQHGLISDAENMVSQCKHHLWQRSCPADNGMLNEHEELAIEGGTIRVSNVYSQGFLNSLAQALQSLGIDLSQASVSVQIDLGKRAISRPPSTTSSSKDHEEPSSCNWAMEHSRVASSGEDSDQVHKRLRTDNR